MKKATLLWITSLTVLFFIVGCGGSGGGGGTPPTPPSASPTKAVIKLSTVGSPSATPLAGVQAIVHLPVGVTVKTATNASQVDTNVIIASGNAVPASLVLGAYSTARATVDAYVVKGNGFTVGEFTTIFCDITADASPKTSDFSVSDLIVSDVNGNFITGLMPSIAVSFQ